MDKTVIAELTATLSTLRTAGETGFWILAVFLLLAIAIAVVALVNQRIVIGRFELTAKATEERFRGVDTQLKAIDTSVKERELGIKERDELRNIFAQQFSIVKETNTELRTEMTRLRERQDGFEKQVNSTITAGLEDIRDRLTKATVKEIIAQIPHHFRRDLEVQLRNSLQSALQRMSLHLQETDVLKEYAKGVTETMRVELTNVIRTRFGDFDPRLVPQWIYRTVEKETGNKEFAEHLARRFAIGEDYRDAQYPEPPFTW